MAKACGGVAGTRVKRNRLGSEGQGEWVLPALLGLDQDQPLRTQNKCVDSAALLAGELARVAPAESTPSFTWACAVRDRCADKPGAPSAGRSAPSGFRPLGLGMNGGPQLSASGFWRPSLPRSPPKSGRRP